MVGLLTMASCTPMLTTLTGVRYPRTQLSCYWETVSFWLQGLDTHCHKAVSYTPLGSSSSSFCTSISVEFSNCHYSYCTQCTKRAWLSSNLHWLLHTVYQNGVAKLQSLHWLLHTCTQCTKRAWLSSNLYTSYCTQCTKRAWMAKLWCVFNLWKIS